MSLKETFQEYVMIARDTNLTEEQKIEKCRVKFTSEESSYKKKYQKQLNNRIKKELGIYDPSIDLFIALN